MGTAFKYLNGHPKCERGAGLLLQSPGRWGEKVACFKSLKARIMVQAALGGGEFPMLGDSSRGNICQGYPTVMVVNLPFVIDPAGGDRRSSLLSPPWVLFVLPGQESPKTARAFQGCTV